MGRGDDHRLDRFALAEEPLAFRAGLVDWVNLVGRRKRTAAVLEAAQIGRAGRIREETLIGGQLLVLDFVEAGLLPEFLFLLHGVLRLLCQARDQVRQRASRR